MKIFVQKTCSAYWRGCVTLFFLNHLSAHKYLGEEVINKEEPRIWDICKLEINRKVESYMKKLGSSHASSNMSTTKSTKIEEKKCQIQALKIFFFSMVHIIVNPQTPIYCKNAATLMHSEAQCHYCNIN